MKENLKLYRGIIEQENVIITEVHSLRKEILIFFEKMVNTNKSLFYIRELIYEEDMTFYEQEIVYLTNNINSIIHQISDKQLLDEMHLILTFISNAKKSDEQIFVWDD